MSDSFSLYVDDEIQLISPQPEMANSLLSLIETNRAFLNQHITFAQNKKELKDVEAFLKEISSFNYGGQKFNLLIQYKGKLAGIIGFHRIKAMDARAEIGYWLGESFQSLGIMTRAMPVFLQYGFEARGINRVDLLTLPIHVRSIALAERAGFVHEGVLREYYFMHDRFYDAHIFSCLKSEFLARLT